MRGSNRFGPGDVSAAIAVAGKAGVRRPSPHSPRGAANGRLHRHRLAGRRFQQGAIAGRADVAEDGARLRRGWAAGRNVVVQVDAENLNGTSWNAVGELIGGDWPDESLILSAHHDTTTDSIGGNDNGAGVAVLLETARLLSTLQQEADVRPGRTIRFVSFGAEEQGLQGSAAYVAKHHGPEPPSRMTLNLDELAAGNMKGVVLQFPGLRPLVQSQLDCDERGAACHVLAQWMHPEICFRSTGREFRRPFCGGGDSSDDIPMSPSVTRAPTHRTKCGFAS